MDDQAFRTAMGKFATGVTVITAESGGEVHGMTANAFMSVSLNPKLVLVSVDEKANMKRSIENAGQFAISILSKSQREMSAYFAGQIKEERSIPFHTFNQMPVIKDAIAYVTCTVHNAIIAGDHTLFIGEVTDVSVQAREPLVFYEGKYKQLIELANV